MTKRLEAAEGIGQRIKRLRKEIGVSQHVLAKKCGVTDSWLSQIEQNKLSPSPALLNQLATVLKVRVRNLLQDVDKRMEMASRIKPAEVLLETNQAEEAERILLILRDQPDLRESHRLYADVHLAEARYQQKQHREFLADLYTKSVSDLYAR